MIRIDATWIITRMATKKTFRNVTIKKFIRKPMSWDGFTFNIYFTIASIVFICGPFPTFILRSNFNFFPESNHMGAIA